MANRTNPQWPGSAADPSWRASGPPLVGALCRLEGAEGPRQGSIIQQSSLSHRLPEDDRVPLRPDRERHRQAPRPGSVRIAGEYEAAVRAACRASGANRSPSPENREAPTAGSRPASPRGRPSSYSGVRGGALAPEQEEAARAYCVELDQPLREAEDDDAWQPGGEELAEDSPPPRQAVTLFGN
eukprot:4228766-Alexandrium_andersonii.AAC.1